MSKVRNIGIQGVEPPATECDDPRCPFHGQLPTRGRIFSGKVISDKMNKSRVVKVSRKARHPLYSKVIKRTTSFMVHDEKNETHLGDRVRIIETRPLSKNKRWYISKIIEKNL